MSPTPPAPNLSAKRLLLPESLGEVLVRPVGKNGDDHPRLQLPRNPERGRDGGPGRETYENALFTGEALDHLVSFLGRGAEVLVGEHPIIDLRVQRAVHVHHTL